MHSEELFFFLMSVASIFSFGQVIAPVGYLNWQGIYVEGLGHAAESLGVGILLVDIWF